VRFDDCDIHHVIHWTRDGVTDLKNLIPLCSLHHHLVHEGGWTLTLQPDRTITLIRPDGSTAFEGRTTKQRPAAPTPQPITVDDVREAVADGLADALARRRGPLPERRRLTRPASIRGSTGTSTGADANSSAHPRSEPDRRKPPRRRCPSRRAVTPRRWDTR
jgi:hypothetical protein